MKFFDRVKESSTTTGTGNFTLSGAATGFRAFSSVLTTNDTCYYCISLQGGSEWETGVGTYSAANTLTRTTILASSNSGNAVNFSAGTKDVFLTVAADRFVSKYVGPTITQPVLSSFSTWVNQGSATFVDNGDGTVSVIAPPVPGDNVRAVVKSTPGSTWTVTAGMLLSFRLSANYSRAGICLRDSSTGKMILFLSGYPTTHALNVEYWDSATANSSIPYTAAGLANKIWFRIVLDSTNLNFYYSFDGNNFTQTYQAAKNTFLANIDQVGLFSYSNTSTAGQNVIATCFHYKET